MSVTTPEPTPVAPVVAARPSFFKRVTHAVTAAVTSPDAVKKEKSLAVFVGVRIALSLGASAGLVEAVSRIVGG